MTDPSASGKEPVNPTGSVAAAAEPSSAGSDTSAEVNLVDRVYARLRADIIEARIDAGTPLRERDLAERLEVSRVPVREALPRLEAGGFVRIEPRRPAVVTHVSFDDLDELFELRGPIEATVARLAAARVAEGADPAALLALLADARSALDGEATGDAHRHFMCCNGLLHAEIVALAGNPLLERVMAPLADRTDRLNGVSQHHDRESRHEEHVLLVEAVTTGNAELAGSCAIVHIERERRRAMSALPSHPHFAGR
ncbi:MULTISPECIES: GntR family transcriptional regulator [Dietzia]|uniref:GntR family transcriptional regulator n=1 Tax=Dietzia cinnamea TaxID=321318 RepID=A0A4R3ZW94_9ACTN|nr:MULTISPECIES: GntR family transcriptional regulator [Dietzia]MBB1021249.1 GntR family transcriptional regulator [Dietzia sp. E1]TCW24992.1 GntR family transcriptional regulator [Dietzia cinnamea]